LEVEPEAERAADPPTKEPSAEAGDEDPKSEA
jgi:hypothetical protein